ncbi:polyphosphate kinase 1 [Cryomorphaceae bacterium 1068]|nr:polyphosphate kinase 1 [Cryomorphaceae bacterium 1068]
MSISLKNRTINRELSWLSFNHRVLQEAQDEAVPLVERLRFLGIFSNNLDEFFRVRVATMKRVEAVSKKKELIGDKTAAEVLDEIQDEVVRQKELFAVIYRNILDELKKHNVEIVTETELNDEQAAFVDMYYRAEVSPLLVPIMLKSLDEFPYLRDKSIFLAVKMTTPKKNKEGKSKQFALIEVPSEATPRFVVLPEANGKKYIMFLDDVIRFNLNQIFRIFNYETLEAYTIKLTRDAELDLDDDISKGFYEKMKKSLKQRTKGEPVRFLYDSEMPVDLLTYLCKKLDIDEDDNIIPGGRYHNSKDFMKFPNVGNADLEYEEIIGTDHYLIDKSNGILNAVDKNDILLHYPYQHFRGFVHFLREAAIHPHVKEIKITLYRVANRSRVVNALVSAAKNGKQVTVVVELRARFDEEANLEWSRTLQDAGVKVIFGISDMKVHCKLAVVTQVHKGKVNRQAVISTGNFHEGTAKVYSDLALFTTNAEICDEALKVIAFIERPYLHFRFKHLLVAPATMRSGYIKKLNREIQNAKAGLSAYVFIKVNSLVDETLIRKLYQASKAGVKIRLLVRGICSLIPGIKGISDNIQVHSIIDRYLEHARVFIFGNDGNEDIYISSADWMERNLDYRVEVSVAIYDPKVRKEIKDMMELQWNDNVKARLLAGNQTNEYVEREKDEKKVRAQMEMYKLIALQQKTMQEEDD